MSSKENGYYKWGRYLLRLILLGFSALATIKVVFFFTDIDEQYAITMAWRMACGDRMFMEMWEPHQTSGFLAALLVKIYMALTGGLDGLVIYLRLCGVAFQALVSAFLYTTVRKICSEDTAFFAALFFYNTLAKYNQMVEYANMLMWFSMLTFLCLLRFFMEKRKRIWLLLAGINTSLMVLSYPTCIIAVPFIVFGILYICEKENRWKTVGIYMGTCVMCGMLWIAYFLSHMTWSQFVYGITQMMTDSSHSATIIQKLAGYKDNLIKILPYVCLVVVLSLVVVCFFRLCLKRKCSPYAVFLIISVIQQFYTWFFEKEHMKFPGIFYFVLLIVGIYRYVKRADYGIDKDDCVRRAMFWFGSITAIGILCATLLASNMRLMESTEYMMIGFIVGICYLDCERKQTKAWWLLVVLALIGVAVFRKGYLMYHAFGTDTIFVTKQKALDGPLSGVYCRYLDGYDYNMRGVIMNQYIPEGSTVLYVGVDTLAYLQGEYNISNFSTISTPSMDERLFEYWDRYPEKYPEYIVWDFKVPTESAPAGSVKEQLLQDAELLIEDEDIQIWKK